jgi:putative phosphoribosyl transferase
MKRTSQIFQNRIQAGQELAEKLKNYADNPNVIVLALPRGGIPIGYEIAKKLNAPLDAFLVRKLGVPWHPELAMGAIAIGGIRVLNEDVTRTLNITPEVIEQVSQQENLELQRRNQLYRHGNAHPDLSKRIVILVDDGLATGATMRAAVEAIKQAKPQRIIVAVPVAPRETYEEFKKWVDEIVCLETPEVFYSISQWYEQFPQTSDEEVIELLAEAKNFGASQ